MIKVNPINTKKLDIETINLIKSRLEGGYVLYQVIQASCHIHPE